MAKAVKKSGLYTDLTPAEYHADPCPMPSLSSSLINVVIDECAARAWAEHPRHPDHEPDDNNKFNLPNVCHALLLNAGRDYTVIEAEDWRTTAAKEARNAAIAIDKIPILEHQLDEARLIVAAAGKQIAASPVAAYWGSHVAKSEVVGVWREGDVWCRMMIDRLWLPNNKDDAIAPVMLDYKTTEAAVNEWTISQYAVNQGWHIQANWYKRGLAKLFASRETWKPPEFIFLVQVRKKPYPLMIVKLSKALDALADRQIEWAIDEWAKGVKGAWTGLSEAVADLPSWYQSQWITRELADDPEAPLEGSNNG